MSAPQLSAPQLCPTFLPYVSAPCLPHSSAPRLISIPDDMDAFTELLWNSLNSENKVSLFVRYIDIATGAYETKIVNKNQ